MDSGSEYMVDDRFDWPIACSYIGGSYVEGIKKKTNAESS
jgi:hypothetical protein